MCVCIIHMFTLYVSLVLRLTGSKVIMCNNSLCVEGSLETGDETMYMYAQTTSVFNSGGCLIQYEVAFTLATYVYFSYNIFSLSASPAESAASPAESEGMGGL